MTRLVPGASGFRWGALPVHADDTHAPQWRAPAATADFELGTPRTRSEHCYPGERPPGSFVVFEDRVLHVRPGSTASGWQVRDADGISDLGEWLSARGQRSLDGRLACLGYGSNLNPQQVAGIGGRSAVVVLRGLTVGLAAAYCATRRTVDDQYPAGLAAAPAERVEHHGVVLIDPERLWKLDRKEGQGSCYSRAAVSRTDGQLCIVLEDGSHLSGVLPVYLQDDERPLRLHGGELVLLCDVHQRDIFFSEPTAQTHAHGLHEAELDHLPALEVTPVPVFVYGTLRPGRSRWSAIEHLIERHEPSHMRGHRFDTGYGFPGLLLDHPDARLVDGDLLHLSPDAHREALEIMDRIEGHPDLYARHLVRIDDGRVAWTYLWTGAG